MSGKSIVPQIRLLGTHRGKQVVFGFDRYILAELGEYIRALSKFGIPVRAVDTDALHYLTSAERVCERVRGRADHVGVLVCATGMGVSIAANKFRGIYAARCLSLEDGEMARTVNNANVLCLAARSTLAVNEAIIDAFMTTPYEGRKVDQLERIAYLEIESEPAQLPDVARLGRPISKYA